MATSIFDIDIQGIKTSPNSNEIVFKELFNTQALANAIKLWITSYKGDFPRQPSKGGYVTRWLFKPMNDTTLENMYISIRDGIQNDFNNQVRINELTITPNYEKRTWKIKMDVYHIVYQLNTTISLTLSNS